MYRQLINNHNFYEKLYHLKQTFHSHIIEYQEASYDNIYKMQ